MVSGAWKKRRALVYGYTRKSESTSVPATDNGKDGEGETLFSQTAIGRRTARKHRRRNRTEPPMLDTAAQGTSWGNTVKYMAR